MCNNDMGFPIVSLSIRLVLCLSECTSHQLYQHLVVFKVQTALQNSDVKTVSGVVEHSGSEKLSFFNSSLHFSQKQDKIVS